MNAILWVIVMPPHLPSVFHVPVFVSLMSAPLVNRPALAAVDFIAEPV